MRTPPARNVSHAIALAIPLFPYPYASPGKNDSPSSSRRRSRRGDGRSFKAGDTVRQSGIYEIIHERDHRTAHEVVMVSGETFPACETCKDRVRFRVIRTAPYIFQDEDFEQNK